MHDIKEINHEIRLGQYFFIGILREGIVLYTSRKFSLATPKAGVLKDWLAWASAIDTLEALFSAEAGGAPAAGS